MKNVKLFKKNYHLFLKQQMMLKGVTIRELSKKIGYSYEGTRILLDGRGSYKGIFKICNAMNVRMQKLLRENVLDGTAQFENEQGESVFNENPC
ncbi:hypothetical protein ACFL2A_06225 [Thermodesulfobacteriota bacterium]